MEAWDSINKVTNYIDENLESQISIEELSEIANLSPFYFQRLFKRLVDKSVMEYIKLRRLAKISEELKINEDDNILDICLKYGFENHETFSRNFKEAYGITPSEYRKNPVILKHFSKPNISLQYNVIDENVPVVTDGIVIEVTKFTLNKPKYFAGYIATDVMRITGIDPLAETWQKLHQTKADIKGYMPSGNEIGINLNLAKRTKELRYFAGVEIKEENNEDFEKFTLKKGRYIVCKFEAEDFNTLVTDTIYKVYSYMYLWVSDKKLMSDVEHVAIELYYQPSQKNTYMELWIPLKEK
jgi:AraC family transcriptional regulator